MNRRLGPAILLLALLPGCFAFDRPSRLQQLNLQTSGAAHSFLGEMPPARSPVEHVSFEVPVLSPPLTPATYKAAEELPLTVDNAISMALQNSDVVRVITGAGSAGLAATSFDPTIQEAQVVGALAAFDTQLQLSQNWDKRDLPAIPVQDRSASRASLSRSFITGTRLQASAVADYSFLPGTGTSASYGTRMELGLTQPLLRGAGTTFNRTPLIVARAGADGAVWAFREALMGQVRSIETAYRELYAAQASVAVLDDVVDFADEIARVQKVRLDQKAAVEADLAQAITQLEGFRQQRIETISQMLANETLLRNLMGIPACDGKRLVAIDSPTNAPTVVDWDSTLPIALENRPDIAQQQLSVLIREQFLIRARNGLMPQMDAVALWRMNGEDPALDDSFRQSLDGSYSDWLLGFSVDLPLRNYAAGSAALTAELSLARERTKLQQSVHNATHEVTARVRDLSVLYAQYEAADARLKAAQMFLDGSRARFQNPRADSELLLLLSVYLGALNDWATATINANQLLAQYNVGLARLAEAKGTLLMENGITVADDVRATLPPGLYDQFLRMRRSPHQNLVPDGKAWGGIPVYRSEPLELN